MVELTCGFFLFLLTQWLLFDDDNPESNQDSATVSDREVPEVPLAASVAEPEPDPVVENDLVPQPHRTRSPSRPAAVKTGQSGWRALNQAMKLRQ